MDRLRSRTSTHLARPAPLLTSGGGGSTSRVMLAPMTVRFDVEGPLAAAALHWQVIGREVWTTFLFKLRCELGPSGALSLGAPPEIATTDRHLADDPGGPLIDASDLVPRLAHGEIYVVRAPELSRAPVPRRVAVVRDGQRLVDKAVGPAQGLAFGPIAASWPARAKLVQPGQIALTAGPLLQLAENLRWDYFQAAAPDQRVTGPFRGDEWIELTGFSEAGLVTLQLPALRLDARVRRKAGEEQPLAPSLDTIRVDPGGRSLVLTYRDTIPATLGEPLAVRAAVTAPIAVKDAAVAAISATSTAPVDPAQIDAPIAPFLQRMKAQQMADKSDRSATPWAAPAVPTVSAPIASAPGVVAPVPAPAAHIPAPAPPPQPAPPAQPAPPPDIMPAEIAPRPTVAATPDPLAPPNVAAVLAEPAQSNRDVARKLALAGAPPEVVAKLLRG